MKVLFTFGGLPHYYNYVLSKLNNVKDLKIIVVIPQSKGETIGQGVFQTMAGINFKLIKVQEYKTWYGKSFLKNLSGLIDEIKQISSMIYGFSAVPSP